jgi:hypothetical protein
VTNLSIITAIAPQIFHNIMLNAGWQVTSTCSFLSIQHWLQDDAILNALGKTKVSNGKGKMLQTTSEIQYMVKEYEYVEKKMINQNFKAIKINILAFTSHTTIF